MANDFAQVKARFQTLLVETREDALRALEVRVDDLLRDQVMDESDVLFGGWGDVRSAEDEGVSSGGATFRQLVLLAQAWGSPKCRFAGDAEVAKRLNLAWRFYNRFVHRGCAFPNNWWAWQIGIPMHVGDALLVAGDAFEADVRDSMVDTLAYLVDNIRTNMTGANAMWGGMNHLRYGLVTGKSEHIELASEWAAKECEIRPVNGILSDYSYSFHGMAVHMGYGRSHFADVGRYVYMMGDSQWQLPEIALSNVANWLLEFVRWIIVGEGIDPFVIGRECSRGEVALRATLIIDGALLLSSAPIPRRDEVMAFCKRAVDDGLLPSNPVASDIAHELTVDAAEPLLGTRYWPVIEYLSARRPKFTAAVKMSSTNTKSWFSIRNENLKAHHTSDGHLILRTGVVNAFLDGVLPTMDWARLTGITRTDGIAMPRETEGQSPFVCGVGDGDLGCCGVDFKIEMENGEGLFAKKSWFFLGDAIVALGSDISCTGSNPVETVVRQVVLREAWDAGEVVDGLLVGHDCVYVFPDRPEVQVKVEKRTGQWHDLSLRQSAQDEVLSRDFAIVSLIHGVRPTQADYAVVYLPGWRREDAVAWWQENPFEIVQKDDRAHVVRDVKNKKVLSVRWGEGAEMV